MSETSAARDAARREAAQRLLAARRSGSPLTDGLPAALRSADVAEGYAVQDTFVSLRGGRAIGYKVAATSPGAQAALGVEGPFYGRLFDDSSVRDSRTASWPADAFSVGLIEPEFALRLGADLAAENAPYDRESVVPAVTSVHPAIEIIDSAYGRQGWMSAGAGNLAADNAAHGAFLLGPGIAAAAAGDLAEHEVSLFVDDVPIGSGSGARALGHPYAVLAWLANTLAAKGGNLRAGEVVTTGVVTPFVYLEEGQTARADFGSLGCLTVTFEAPSRKLEVF